MGSVEAKLAALSVTQREELELLLLDFDVAWSPEALAACAGQLPPDDHDYRQVVLIELARVDLERQWQAESKPQVEDYLARFPELGTKATSAPELLLAEYQARQLSGQPVELNEFARRFPQQVEQLKQLLEKSHQSASHQPSRAAHTDTSREGEMVATHADSAGQSWSLPKEFGRYRILKLLGEGGMGSVYLAHDTELDRQVAIKTPKFAGGEDPRLVERFYREARAAARLQNRHICPVYDVGEMDGVRYISMAYIEGRPLSAYTRTAHHQPERSVVLVIRRLALALQEAHAQGVVHRDLKPANIMIDGKREPVIMDFGLARQLDKHDDSRLTQPGSVVGSPAYMSPEQVSGEIDRVGPASDIYSLGVILFELLTGRVPFEGSTIAVLGQIMTQDPPPPSEFREGLDPRLEQICLKMMAKRIEDRYELMQDVAAALGQWLAQPANDGADSDAGAEGMSPAEGDDQQSEDMFATRYARGSSSSVDGPAGQAASSPMMGVPGWTRSKTVVSIAAGIVGLSLLGLLIALRTPHGLLTIEVEDPNLNVLIDGNEYTFEQLTEPQHLAAGSHRLAVRVGETAIPIGKKVALNTAAYEGEYKLALKLDGASLTSESFTIVRGDDRILSVTLESLPQPKSSDHREDPPRESLLPRAAEASRTVPTIAIAPFDEARAKEHQQAWADHLGVTVTWENSIGMTMVLIPPGEFMMGSDEKEIEALLKKGRWKNRENADEIEEITASAGPKHLVRITEPFYLAATEVTTASFADFVTAESYQTQAETNGKGDSWNVGIERVNDHPVVKVSWNDAQAFCAWLSTKEGIAYSLPSEAQWEYAARSGSTSCWHFGDNLADLRHYAWYGNDLEISHPQPVAQKLPNAFGLHDTIGNVWEWCSDRYSASYYSQSPTDNPTGPDLGRWRVLRGGTYFNSEPNPALRHKRLRSVYTFACGFRPARIIR